MKKQFCFTDNITCAAIASGLVFASPLISAQQDEPPTGDARKLEEIVVMAQRRSESLQEVPVTVTVFGADEIRDAQIQQIDDIVTRTPGLSFDNFPATQPRLFIRGIGSSDRGAAGDPSAAVFIDEIYLGRPSAVAFDAFDVERIEVLKGPQGTLFGRNVVGGAINVINKRPDPNALGASVNFTAGNYGRADVAGHINTPFADNTSAIRLSVSSRTQDGYVRNEYLDEDVDDQDTKSARLQISSEPTEDLSLLLTLDKTRDRHTGSANHVLELDTSDPLSNFYTPNFDPDVTYGTDPGYQDRDTQGLRLEISNHFSFGTLTLLGSYRDLDYSFRYDFDGGNPDPTSPGFNAINIGGGNDEESDMASVEIRLSSPSDSTAQWVLGLYHYQQNVERSDILTLDAPVIVPFEVYEAFLADASLDSYAAFGDISYPLADRWTVFAGLRYTLDDKTQRIWNTESDIPLRADEFYDVTVSDDFDDWTFRTGFEFMATDDHFFYASVANGFKSGGFQDSAGTAAAAAVPYNPETAVQYEIGQKSTFFGGSMIWNNTIYYMDYADLQTGQVIDGQNFTYNAGEATIKGYETQFSVNPFEGFQFSLGYAYTDAVFDEIIEGGVDYSGNVISRSPKHEVSVSPSYTVFLANNAELTFAADYRYASKIYDDNNNLPPEIRDPTSFVDARASIDDLWKDFRVSVWGKNLTDERTRTFQGGFLGTNFGAFIAPKTYGLTVSWEH